MFACSVGLGTIHVFNFYTAECPQNMICKGHVHRVRSIDWFENDSGFSSCDMMGNQYFYDMQLHKEEGKRFVDKDFVQKGVQFTGVCNIPNKNYEVLLVGNDKNIWHVTENNAVSESAGE